MTVNALADDASASTTISGRLLSVLKVAGVAFQLLFILLIIREFRLVTVGAADMLKIAAVGMVVHALLPRRYRQPFFAALSLVTIPAVLGPVAGAVLLAIGLGLIGLAHLPVAFWVRVTLLVVVGAILMLLRGEWLALAHVPLLAAVWPVLGSIFMFRLIIYVYDRRHDPEPATLSSTLSYFFVLPNVAFPFFPVIDYRTFRRTYYDREEFEIYRKGITWMFRGVLHLILYRLVYYYLTLAPADIENAGQLIQFLITNYLLYLRVSGLFHLIVGLLLLFGFNLPETHHLYLFASSFTDYWRRINIYWKDFMMKVFYYPAFFRLRRFGGTAALVIATLIVFAATTVLHSYQWFWIRGDTPISTQDVIFWSILALLVVVNAVWETKKGRKRSLGRTKRSGSEIVVLGAKTAATFATICILWSLWTASSIQEWLAMWTALEGGVAFDAKLGGTFVATGLVIGTVMVGGGTPGSGAPGWWGRLVALSRSPFVSPALIVGFFALGHPSVYQRLNPTASYFIESLQHDRLNSRDQSTLERGYYENLLGAERNNAELWSRYSKRPADWRNLWETDVARQTTNWLPMELIPSTSIRYKGATFTTNQWGMRDRAYSKEKPGDTYRIAILGSSSVMGSGVEDNETFEALLEARLNAERGVDDPHYELLNFAVESYNAPVQGLVVDRALEFEPDAVWYIAHEVEFEKSIGQAVDILLRGEPIEDPEFADFARRARVDAHTIAPVANRRVKALETDLMLWAYRRVAQAALARGVKPVWVFVPMPVGGRGAPCAPGRQELFCFGSVSRPGAAADRSDPRVATLFDLATKAGFEVVDLSGVYEGRNLESLWISAWDGHPNAVGHALAAERLYEVVRAEPSLLEPLRPGSAQPR